MKTQSIPVQGLV